MNKVNIGSNDIILPAKKGSVPLRLLHMISKNHASSKYTAIENNFLLAAMHIACMSEFLFPCDSIPDLLDKFEKLVPA